MVMEPSTRTALVWHGSCAARHTPASTFELPLAIMGFDSGFLKSSVEPSLQSQPGDLDSEGAASREPTNPQRWMRLSSVWYSQKVAAAVGDARLRQYAKDFKLGNADLSGDRSPFGSAHPAWVDSSLQISPLEQVEFISRSLTGELPASKQSVEHTRQLLESQTVAGWTLRGKTGSAFPRNAAGRPDSARGLGWYIGWAEKDGRSLAFAHLAQDQEQSQSLPGTRARAHVLQQWSSIVELLR